MSLKCCQTFFVFVFVPRYDSDPRLRTSIDSNQAPPTSPRPLGLFELSKGLALDRGPAFSPAQLSIGRRLMERGEMTASGSQDSLPFAEEDASLVDSPDCDLSKNAPLRKHPPDTLRCVSYSLCQWCKLRRSHLFHLGTLVNPIAKCNNLDRLPFWHRLRI